MIYARLGDFAGYVIIINKSMLSTRIQLLYILFSNFSLAIFSHLVILCFFYYYPRNLTCKINFYSIQECL